MPFKSPYPDIDIPQTDLLSFLFPPDKAPSTDAIWIDSQDTNLSLSPAQLLSWVKRLASGLQALGAKRGEVVMIHTPNHIFVPVALLGIVGGGFAFSGANPAYTVPELVHQLKTTKASVLLVHPNLLSTALPAAKEALLSNSRIFLFSDTPTAPHSGIQDWRTLLPSSTPTQSPLQTLTPSTSLTTVATINFSSGTTGLPKGVCVAHHNIIANILQTIAMLYTHYPTPPIERWLGFLPLYHAYGQLWTIAIALRLNTPVYVMKSFVFTDFLAAIQRFRITNLHLAPPVLVMLSKRPETREYDLSSVKSALCGAAPLARELQRDVSARFGVVINQGWGMTELTCGGIWVPGGVVDERGSIGCLGPNAEAVLVDEEGKEVGVSEDDGDGDGKVGELWFRGPQVCLGYLGNEEATKESWGEFGGKRWWRTGDVARRDTRGWVWLVDRMKELIKVNALQVAPAELESVLLSHPSIADAAVVGITLHGEEWPRAYVVLQEDAQVLRDDSQVRNDDADAKSARKLTPQDIQQWIKPLVAKHKHLVGSVKFVPEVPKLASGKIVRKVVRGWARYDAVGLEREGWSGRVESGRTGRSKL